MRLFIIFYYIEEFCSDRDVDWKWGQSEREVWAEFKKENNLTDDNMYEIYEVSDAIQKI